MLYFSHHFDWVQESLISHPFEALSPPLSLPLQINDVGPQSLISPHHSRKALHVWFKCLRCQWIQLLFVIQCLIAVRWRRENLISSRFSDEKHSLNALERLLVGGNTCLYGLPYWPLQRSCTCTINYFILISNELFIFTPNTGSLLLVLQDWYCTDLFQHKAAVWWWFP